MDAQILFPSWTSGTQRGGYGLRILVFILLRNRSNGLRNKSGKGWKSVPQRLKPYLFSIVCVRAEARTLQSSSELEIDEVPMTKKAIEDRGVDTGVIGERAKYR
jgi:hypothetical protein